MFTKHGHHIPGTVLGEERPEKVIRCGGPGLCKECSEEVQRAMFAPENSYEPLVLESTPATVHQIPPAPLSDEELRLECLKLAVEMKSHFTAHNRDKDTVNFAKVFYDYVRPTT